MRRLGQRGIGVLHLVILLAVMFLIMQLLMLGQMRNESIATRQLQLREMKLQLINSLLETVRNEMTIRNSRLDVNSFIIKCLAGDPSCLESELYDFIIYSPTPPYVFTGAWPPPPAGLIRLLGGMNQNQQFYNIGGGRCPASFTEMNNYCPLQAIGRIRPLCGGTFDAPAISIPGGGVCLTPATGFEIVIGVASFWEGNFLFNETIDSGDQRTVIVSARTFIN